MGKVLNIELALEHVDGDAQLLSELAEMFVQDYPRMSEDLREGILHNDCDAVERIAHTLKGRLAFFGIERMRDKLSELEKMARENDLTVSLELLTEIRAGMEPILMAFESLIRK